MLQYKSVYPETLELLKELMKFPELNDFFLVGGTAIALYLGHRFSIDLDLFAQTDFNAEKLKIDLDKTFKIISFEADVNTLNTIIEFKEKDIKVEFISYKYKLIKPVKIFDGIRLLELEDLISMKLSAIAGRGSKKDFYDIYFLLEKYSLNQMLEFFREKYGAENLFYIIKSLTFFDDAELEPNPVTHLNISWQEIKNKILKEVNKILK